MITINWKYSLQLVCHQPIGVLNELKACECTLIAPSLQVVLFSDFPTSEHNISPPGAEGYHNVEVQLCLQSLALRAWCVWLGLINYLSFEKRKIPGVSSCSLLLHHSEMILIVIYPSDLCHYITAEWETLATLQPIIPPVVHTPVARCALNQEFRSLNEI